MIEHLNSAERTTLMDLASIAHSLNTPLMLVGANARRLAFDLPFGLTSPRTTQDWDFAVPMANWESFTRFHGQATQGLNALFRHGNTAQRLIHQSTGTPVDLIPFGALAEAGTTIRWPESQQVMSVLGLEEAFEACTHETLPNGNEIRIANPALLAALKLIAVAERGGEFPRDLHDLWFIMECYARPPTQENRAFEELGELPEASFYEHLNTVLLGWDIGRQCRAPTLAAIERMLKELASDDSRRIESLVPRTGDATEQEATRQKIASEFGWVQRGIDLARQRKKSP